MQKPLPPVDDVLCAGGTLSVPQLSVPARVWRFAEMALLYGAAPFAVDRAVHAEGIPVFIALLPVLAIILMFLVLDRTFSLHPRAVARLLAAAAVLHPRDVCGGWRHRRHVRVDVPPGPVPRVSAQPS